MLVHKFRIMWLIPCGVFLIVGRMSRLCGPSKASVHCGTFWAGLATSVGCTCFVCVMANPACSMLGFYNEVNGWISVSVHNFLHSACGTSAFLFDFTCDISILVIILPCPEIWFLWWDTSKRVPRHREDTRLAAIELVQDRGYLHLCPTRMSWNCKRIITL